MTDQPRNRSVWQVLVFYLGGAFVALQAVEQIVESVGLPGWVRAYSLILLVLGLPIVLVTAGVQGRRVSLEATESAQSLSDGRRWFSWRNTAFAGLGGVLLITLATAAYLVMRTAGIGPAGTLAAQGSLQEGAEVILADFESSDPDLGSVVTNALRIDLLQSPFLDVVEPSELAAGLDRMELEADAAITSEVARELAVRDGYDAVIEGEVGVAGDGYVLTARIVGGEDWTSLAAFRSTARSDDDLIDAIEDLSRDIRDKSGESLRSARGGRPLRAVTTGSLEALLAYDRGLEAFVVGSRTEAIEWYERAIEIDPEFAMAYRRLAAMLGGRREEQIAAATRAFELRDRLTELERLLAEAYYYSSVVGDLTAGIRAYERMIELAPAADITRNGRHNLAVSYMLTGRFEEAERLYTDLVAERPYQTGVNQLAHARITLGDVEGAWVALQDGSDALPETDYQFANRGVSLAVALDDLPMARDYQAAFAEKYPGPRDVWRRSNHIYLIGANEGRLEAASEVIADRWSHPVDRARRRAFIAATLGDSAGALRVLLEGWEEGRPGAPADRRYDTLLPDLIKFGGLPAAEEIIEEWDREVPVEINPRTGAIGRLEVEAEVEFARGRHRESIAAWEAYEEACPTCSSWASYGLGRAYEALGDRARAIDEFERSLEPINQYDTDPYFRADAFRRLARLHEEAGQNEQAAVYYERIVERWGAADPSLQPQIEAARARLDELGS